MAETLLAIGGVRFHFATARADVLDVLNDRYNAFRAAGRGDWLIDVDARPEGPVDVPDLIVRPASDGGFEVERYDFLARIDPVPRRARLALGDIDDIAVDSFLRVVCSLALLDVGGLLLHASSVARDERAWVFPGRSGAGKTTVTRLSPDAALLSDELSIVRVHDDGRARCWGTPFWGELARAGENRAAEVRGVYLLRQAAAHAAERLTPRDALVGLLPNVMFFTRDAALTARVLGVAARLVETTPCFTLSFRRDPGFWDVIA